MDETIALPILTIELTGGGRSPAILFDAPFVMLPAVPLGIVSKAQFTIINDGYDNVDLSYRLPADEQHLPLQLDFPQGTIIGMAKASVPVIVSFCAERPTSFTCDIEILDDDGMSVVQFVTVNLSQWHTLPESWIMQAVGMCCLFQAAPIVSQALYNLSSLVTAGNHTRLTVVSMLTRNAIGFFLMKANFLRSHCPGFQLLPEILSCTRPKKIVLLTC